ncbi:MAG TPA: chlorite dismutase family protein, partial [Phycisphaerae bacterium]
MSETSTPASSPASHGRPSPQAQRGGAAPAPIRRQYVSFAFYKLMPEFRRLPLDQQRSMLNQFAETVEKNDRQKMILLTYSCVGTRADCDIMFWKISFDLADLQRHSAAINRLPLAGYLATT